MRTVVLLMSLGLTNTSMAQPASLPETVNSLQPSPAAEASEGSGGVAEMPVDWNARYHAGQKLADVGKNMGWLGLASIFGGLAMLEMNSVEGNKELAAPIAVSGLLVVWAGSGVAAYGTSKEHKALVQMGAVPSGCLGCVGAWVAAIYPPVLGWGISYVVSGAQRRADERTYRALGGESDDTVSFQISPMATPSGLGFGLNGSF
jgi:hypothetical protein